MMMRTTRSMPIQRTRSASTNRFTHRSLGDGLRSLRVVGLLSQIGFARSVAPPNPSEKQMGAAAQRIKTARSTRAPTLLPICWRFAPPDLHSAPRCYTRLLTIPTSAEDPYIPRTSWGGLPVSILAQRGAIATSRRQLPSTAAPPAHARPAHRGWHLPWTIDLIRNDIALRHRPPPSRSQ